MPNGKKLLAMAEPSGSMLNRLDASNFGIRPTTVAIRATTATKVMPNISFSASPTPHRWTPTKIR